MCDVIYYIENLIGIQIHMLYLISLLFFLFVADEYGLKVCVFVYKQMCTRDEASLRRHSRSQSRAARSKRGIFSSQKGLDTLSRRNREKRQSLSQVSPNHTY